MDTLDRINTQDQDALRRVLDDALNRTVGQPRRGLLVALAAPSGAGKTTIARGLVAEGGASFSISATTRQPRPGERHGVDYYFMTEADFSDLAAQGSFLEHAKVFGNFYGTPFQPVEDLLSAGIDVLLDIDWQGARQVAQRMPRDLVSIFLLPPSSDELERRLRGRGTDSEAVISGRMAKAADEISHWDEFDYVLINDDVDACRACVRSILDAERIKRRNR